MQMGMGMGMGRKQKRRMERGRTKRGRRMTMMCDDDDVRCDDVIFTKPLSVCQSVSQSVLFVVQY
jgi:hypothetical protein